MFHWSRSTLHVLHYLLTTWNKDPNGYCMYITNEKELSDTYLPKWFHLLKGIKNNKKIGINLLLLFKWIRLIIYKVVICKQNLFGIFVPDKSYILSQTYMYWKQLSCNNIVVLTSFSHIKIDSKWKAAVIVSHKKIFCFYVQKI